MLQDASVPFVFVTNGGGKTEEDKALELSKRLQLHVRVEQVLLSHTPMKDLAAMYANQRVLILGQDRCLGVAKSYGFADVVSCNHVHVEQPHMFPLRQPNLDRYRDHIAGPISAAFIFDDPVDWGLDMQTLADVLGMNGGGPQQIPLYSSNSDIVFMSEHSMPRFTQGAFLLAFQGLFEGYSGRKLLVERFGKPHPVQYRYAERMLHDEAQRLGLPTPDRFVGIGDNPRSDIRGARNAGDHWESILVRTGVFRGEDNDAVDPAHHVVGDVLDAVEVVLSKSLST
jgi:HAD superfamily hydrolase (TIGR01456 family)